MTNNKHNISQEIIDFYVHHNRVLREARENEEIKLEEIEKKLPFQLNERVKIVKNVNRIDRIRDEAIGVISIVDAVSISPTGKVTYCTQWRDFQGTRWVWTEKELVSLDWPDVCPICGSKARITAYHAELPLRWECYETPAGHNI